MRREVHVRFCERLAVTFRGPTPPGFRLEAASFSNWPGPDEQSKRQRKRADIMADSLLDGIRARSVNESCFLEPA